MSTSNPVPVEELLAQREWVRRFAAALVRNRDDADDLAQDAFASALRTPPVAGTSLRGWFATVMRNRVRDAARRRAVTAESLPLVARDEAGGLSPADLTERAETERLVISLVLELPEDFRDAVLMRFWQGKEPAEIAKLRGIAPATVRTRIHRGIAAVREKLDERDRKGRWKAVLLLASDSEFRQPRASPSSAPKLGAAAVVVAAAGIAAWMWTSEGAAPDSSARGDGEDTAQTQRTSADRRADRAATPDRPPDPVATATPDAAPAPREVQVRVVGPDGTAAANAELWALSAAPAKDVTTRVERAGSVSADGTAHFAWPFEEGPGRVLARSGTLCGVSKPFEIASEQTVEVRLETSFVLAGQVVDDEGRGIADAALHLECEFTGSLESVAVTTSHADGHFEFASLPVSLAGTKGFADVRAEGFASDSIVLREVRTQEPLRITMLRALVVTGRVVDDRGRPLAEVEVDFSTGDNVFTGADGRFRSQPLRAETVRIGVLSDQHAAASLSIENPAPGLRDVGDVVLGPGEPLRGRVLFADGSIAARVWVGVEDTSVSQYVRQGQADAEGRFSFEHLGAGPLELLAHGPSEGLHAGSSATVKDVRPGPNEVVITLSAGRSLVVFLADADTGKPIAAESIVLAVKPEDGGEGAATTVFDRADGTSSVRMAMAREGPFLVTVKVRGFADFGPERVVVGTSGETRLDAKLRQK